jgi:beta-barrel assembly-enhancing protease
MRVTLFALCLTLHAQDPAILKEMALGRQLAAEVRGTTGPVDSQVIQDYVAQLGSRIAAQFPDRGIVYTFSVVEGWAGQLNEPLVLPGAYVFVPLELFTSANDEAEFAAMLIQAAAHSTFLAEQRSGPAIYFGSTQDRGVIPMGSLPRLVQMESKADASAVPVMARAGFDPSALLRYIERLQSADSVASKYFSMLPPKSERIAALQEALRDIPAAPSTSSDAFTTIREQVRAMIQSRPHPALQRR